MGRSFSGSDKKSDKSEKTSSSEDRWAGGDAFEGGISFVEFLDVGEVCSVGAILGGVVGGSGEGLGADIVAAKLDDVSWRSTGGIIVRSSSDNPVLSIGVSLSSKSSPGKRSPPFGTFGIY